MRKGEKLRQLRFYFAIPFLVFGILMLSVPSFGVDTVCTVFGTLLSAVALTEFFLFFLLTQSPPYLCDLRPK